MKRAPKLVEQAAKEAEEKIRSKKKGKQQLVLNLNEEAVDEDQEELVINSRSLGALDQGPSHY